MTVPLILPSTINLEGIFAATGKPICNPPSCTMPSKPKKKMVRIRVNDTTSTTSGIRIPSSSLEWKRALAEVKRDYIERKYRSCARRCQDLLDGVKITEHKTAQAVHLVYLHFYAATALEMQLRSLHHSSPSRRDLLSLARDHYRRAAILAEAEGETVSQLISSRSASPTASECSTAPSTTTSASLSESTSTSSVSTRMSSPSPEYSQTMAARKHIAFHYVPKHQVPEHTVIRPDSPTLGHFSYDDYELDSQEERIPTLELTSKSENHVLHEDEDEEDAEDLYERTRTIERYASALTSLFSQIKQVHLPATTSTSSSSYSETASVSSASSSEDMRSLELKARIEKLRASGWQRKRFDAKRYEALREAALADLVE